MYVHIVGSDKNAENCKILTFYVGTKIIVLQKFGSVQRKFTFFYLDFGQNFMNFGDFDGYRRSSENKIENPDRRSSILEIKPELDT